MSSINKTRVPLFIFLVFLSGSGHPAYGANLLDYLREYDLNDYSLGLAVSTKQSPYLEGENSNIVYPYLTSFRDRAFTRDWLVLAEGDVGLRWINDSDWEFGLVGRIQTLGFGNNNSPLLKGLQEREWGLELAPTIGWRALPIHVNFKTYTELLGRHDGLISQLALSWPLEWSRGYIVPSLEAIHQSDDYANYYYGISATEANPVRPAYTPGSALNTALKIRWGYALSEIWLLSGGAGIEYLDSVISDSPIVEKDTLWSANIGLAYNANIFQARNVDGIFNKGGDVEFRVAVFNDNIETTVFRDIADLDGATEIDLSDLLGISDKETIWQLDSIFRIGKYHRIELGYFELERHGFAQLQENLRIGVKEFAASTTIQTSIDTKILRASYGYSIIRDDQKELAILAGVHYSRFKMEVVSESSGQQVVSNHTIPLPVVGVQGSVALGSKLTVGARLELFRMEFDRHEGSLSYLTFELLRNINENMSVGLAYNWYQMKIETSDRDNRDTLEVRHRGPSLFLSVSF